MIPFKAIKYSVVLIILICIQKSLQKEAKFAKRRFDFQDFARTSLYSNARAPPSKYIQDVRADSRRARIDSRDIRTDFREIMDLSSARIRHMDSRREGRLDDNTRSREFTRRDAPQFTRNRDFARMDATGHRNRLRSSTTRDSRIISAREDVSGTQRIRERLFVAAGERDARDSLSLTARRQRHAASTSLRGEVRSSRDTSDVRIGNLARRDGREADTRESPLSITRDSKSIRRSAFSDGSRDPFENQVRARREETRLAEKEATREQRREVIAEAEQRDVRFSIKRAERDLAPTRDGPSGLNRNEIGRFLSSERRDFSPSREGRRFARTAARRNVPDAESTRDTRFSFRRNGRDLMSARSSGSIRREETRFTRVAATKRDVRRNANARNVRLSIIRIERDLSSSRDESPTFMIPFERREFRNADIRREESRSVRASANRDINAREARLSNVRSEGRDLPPNTIREDRIISASERIRDSSEIYRKNGIRIEEFRTLSRDVNNGDINNDLNRAETMDDGFYTDTLLFTKDAGRSNIVRNAIEAAAIIWLVGIISRQNVKGGLGVFRSWLQPCKIN